MALLSEVVESNVGNPFWFFSFCFASFSHLYQVTLNCTGINAIQHLLQVPSSSETLVKATSRNFVTTRTSRELSCHTWNLNVVDGPWVLCFLG